LANTSTSKLQGRFNAALAARSFVVDWLQLADDEGTDIPA
jgi:hypothetical protein